MNGQEKSDPAIVAERPTNEAERSASEPAEPRAGAEGKTLRQSAFRTQGRVDASQALERIRQAATLRRQSPEVGAVCGNPARTVLCGGRSAMSVPTAINPWKGLDNAWIFLGINFDFLVRIEPFQGLARTPSRPLQLIARLLSIQSPPAFLLDGGGGEDGWARGCGKEVRGSVER